MACKRRLRLVGCKIVDLEGGVVRGSNIFFVIGRECEISDGLCVGLNFSNIIEIRLPKLHNPVVVSRNEPFLAMRVDCSSNCRIVRL